MSFGTCLRTYASAGVSLPFIGDVCGRLLYQSTGRAAGSALPAGMERVAYMVAWLGTRTVLDTDSSSKDFGCRSISRWNRSSLPLVWGCLMRAMTCLLDHDPVRPPRQLPERGDLGAVEARGKGDLGQQRAGHHDPVLLACCENVHKRHPPLVAQSPLAKKMTVCIWHMLNKRQFYRFCDQKAYQAKLASSRTRRLYIYRCSNPW